MRRTATGVLSFASGNRVAVKDGRWRRIQHDIFENNFVKNYYFSHDGLQ